MAALAERVMVLLRTVLRACPPSPSPAPPRSMPYQASAILFEMRSLSDDPWLSQIPAPVQLLMLFCVTSTLDDASRWMPAEKPCMSFRETVEPALFAAVNDTFDSHTP